MSNECSSHALTVGLLLPSPDGGNYSLILLHPQFLHSPDMGVFSHSSSTSLQNLSITKTPVLFSLRTPWAEALLGSRSACSLPTTPCMPTTVDPCEACSTGPIPRKACRKKKRWSTWKSRSLEWYANNASLPECYTFQNAAYDVSHHVLSWPKRKKNSSLNQ